MASGFQEITVIVALVLLVICLIIIGISLYNNTYKSKYPPVTGDCPDYWKDVGTSGSLCKNVQNLGTCDITQKSFVGSEWQGSSGLCNKSEWAKGCDLTWDGVTNNNTACSTN